MTNSEQGGRWLLAIDTSTGQAGLALTDGVQLSELSWPAGRDQTVTVLAQIDHLLSVTGIEAARIEAIGVATGPGMFNGLRVGMSLAKGFHAGLGAKLIGVSTLEIGAVACAKLGIDIVPVVAAGRGRLVWQFFPGAGPPVNGTIEELSAALAGLTEPLMVTGDLTAEQAETLTMLSHAIVPAAAVRRRRPGVLAEIAWARFSAGDVDDPVTLAPVYLHAAPVTGSG